jgi:hypothetical protein
LTIALPTEKTKPTLSSTTAKVLLYGPPKIGKTTLAGTINPDHTLILATEAGQGALEAFIEPVESWTKFREVYAALSTGNHSYKTVVLDTVDLLLGMCQAEAMKELGVQHPSDLEWGKGWNAVADKFKLAIGGLSSLGLGIWFVSHAKDIEIKQRVGTINRAVPSLSGASRDFVVGFCDHIFYMTSADTEAGEQRVIKTDASEYWEAGSRLPAVRALGQVILGEDTMAADIRQLLEA